jgi:hypothetical protein
VHIHIYSTAAAAAVHLISDVVWRSAASSSALEGCGGAKRTGVSVVNWSCARQQRIDVVVVQGLRSGLRGEREWAYLRTC